MGLLEFGALVDGGDEVIEEGSKFSLFSSVWLRICAWDLEERCLDIVYNYLFVQHIIDHLNKVCKSYDD